MSDDKPIAATHEPSGRGVTITCNGKQSVYDPDDHVKVYDQGDKYFATCHDGSKWTAHLPKDTTAVSEWRK